MVHVDELPDGRFNIVLRGLATFVMREELPPEHAYREARVTWREDREDSVAGTVRDTLVGLVRIAISTGSGARPRRRRRSIVTWTMRRS